MDQPERADPTKEGGIEGTEVLRVYTGVHELGDTDTDRSQSTVLK